jgi:hypothetical protein
LLPALLLAFVFLVQASPAAASTAPWVTASNGHFVDSTGNTVLLRGVDVVVGPSNLYQRAAALGANFVRLSVAWEQVEPSAPVGGVHHYDPAYLGYLDQQVSWYESQHVNVLIDLHQSGWSSYFAALSDGSARGEPPWLYQGHYPATQQGLGQAKTDFYTNTQVASWYGDLLTMLVNRYASHPNVVGYEIMNEPQSGTWGPTHAATQAIVDWEARMARLVAGLDPQRTVFFQTRAGGDLGLENADLSGFTALPHVALDLHDYYNGVGGLTPDAEDWSPSWDATHNQSSSAYGGSLASQEEILVRALDGARRHGWPLLVGEWGTPASDPNIAPYQSQMLTLFSRYGVSWTRWALTTSGSMAILNADGSPTVAALQLRQALTTTSTGFVDDQLPAVTGAVGLGAKLSATQGRWLSTVDSYQYQWLRCGAGGSACAAIAGATTSSYTVTSADAESRLRVRVTVSGPAGVSSALSAASTAVPALAPQNTSLPQVTGKAQLGQTLLAGVGVWAGTISSYAYQWLSCDAGGASCTALVGATKTSYITKSADIGRTLRVRVTATGPGGTTTADSPATAPVAPLAIADVTRPKVTGTTVAGQRLTGDKGTWSGTISGYAWQWQRCDTAGAHCAAITGATNSDYMTRTDDVGHTLVVSVTATGPGGSATASSPASASIAAVPITNVTLPPVTGVAQAGSRLQGDTGSWNGTITAYAYQWERCDAVGGGCVDVVGATSSRYTPGDGDVGHAFRLRVTASGPGGSASATSAATAKVAELAPSNQQAPVLNGTPVVGHGYLLSIGLGSWSGSNLVFTFRWEQCNASGTTCTPMTGLTAKSYKLTTADLGYRLRAYVRATNSAGSVEVATALSPVIVTG